MRKKSEEASEPETDARKRFGESSANITFLIQHLEKGARDYTKTLKTLQNRIQSAYEMDEKERMKVVSKIIDRISVMTTKWFG